MWSSGSNVCASLEKEKQGPLLAVAFHTDIFISFFSLFVRKQNASVKQREIVEIL